MNSSETTQGRLHHVTPMLKTTNMPDTLGPEPCLTGQLYFLVDDALAIHTRVKDHAEIEWGPEVYSYGMREFAVKDPSGYILTFGERTTDPPDSPHP